MTSTAKRKVTLYLKQSSMDHPSRYDREYASPEEAEADLLEWMQEHGGHSLQVFDPRNPSEAEPLAVWQINDAMRDDKRVGDRLGHNTTDTNWARRTAALIFAD